MPGTTDKIKGRAKVAAGAVTGDKSLETEGRLDRFAGEAKDTLDEATKAVEAWLGTFSDRAGGVVRASQKSLEDLINKARR